MAMHMFCDRAANPNGVEYIFALNADDPTADQVMKLVEAELLHPSMPASRFARIDFVQGDFHGSAPAWDAAAKVSTGAILIQGQDDVEPPVAWDSLLLKRLSESSDAVHEGVPFFVAVGDGYRKDALCCTAIMSRGYYDLEGHFLFPGYMSVYSDDEVTYRALRNARDDKSYFIEARDIVFLHRHHYHDKSVPMDATYARENHVHAYALGQKLFLERNPRALTDGLKTW